MPPLFTSTSWTTLVRVVTSAAKQVHPQGVVQAAVRAPVHAKGRLGAGGLTAQAHRVRLALRRLAHQTFPSVSQPSHHLAYSLQPIRLAARPSKVTPASLRGHVRHGSTSVFRTAYRLPRGTPSGPAIQSQVGLGSARTFASGPASTVYHSKVPIGFRAFISLLNDDEHSSPRLPRASRYRPYDHKARNRRLRRHAPSPCASIDSSIIAELSHYFPLPRKSITNVPLPLCPEQLVTAGKVATLSLPLAPELHALLDPVPFVTYREAEIGRSVLSNLCQGGLSIMEAFDLYRQHRLTPLLAKLESLGVLRAPIDSTVRAEAFVIRDAAGRPDILRLVFHERSASDLRTILGESLRPGEEGNWWALTDRDAGGQAELKDAEVAAILEDWADVHPRPAAATPAPSSPVLVFPTLEIDVLPQQLAETWATGGSITPLSNYSSPTSADVSDTSTPSSDASFSASLTASLLSQLSDAPSSTWHVQPSEEDYEVESAVSVDAVEREMSSSDGWSIEHLDEDERPPSPGAFASWSGAGQGFGLAQPW